MKEIEIPSNRLGGRRYRTVVYMPPGVYAAIKQHFMSYETLAYLPADSILINKVIEEWLELKGIKWQEIKWKIVDDRRPSDFEPRA